MLKGKLQVDWGHFKTETLLLSIFDDEMDCDWKMVG